MRSRLRFVLPAMVLALLGVLLSLRRPGPAPPASRAVPPPHAMLQADPAALLYDQDRPPGPQPDPFPPIPRAKVGIRGELRNALLVPRTSRFSFAVRVPRWSFLQIGAAVLRADADFRRPGVTFTVKMVTAEGARRTVFSRFVDPRYNHEDRYWIDARIAMSADSEQDATLEFETTSDDAPAPKAPEYAVWSVPRLQTMRKPQRPSVILISIDTLRADRLGCYGYSRSPTSPSLDRLAGQGARFAWAYAQAPWTTPSRALYSRRARRMNSRGVRGVTIGPHRRCQRRRVIEKAPSGGAIPGLLDSAPLAPEASPLLSEPRDRQIRPLTCPRQQNQYV